MTPKTERFEMRLDPSLVEKIDSWRSKQRHEPSRSEAVRSLVEIGLSGTDAAIRPDGYQRLIMWMLAEVLKGQPNADAKRTAELVQDAIYGGHFWALEWEMPGSVHSDIDNKEDVSFVVDVLDMWDFIEISYSKLSDSDKDRIEVEAGPTARNPQFTGFDGNQETSLMGIAKFLINKMNRFTDFSDRSLNSHIPKTARYKKMLAAFEPMRANSHGANLSADQLISLLKRS